MSKKIMALFADPVAHSFSPIMHTYGFQTWDIDAEYLLVQSTPETLQKDFQKLEAQYGEQFIGANFSFPNKKAMVTLADIKDSTVQRVGAGNTIVKEKGLWKAYNTDGKGFFLALKEKEYELKGKTLTLLGSGSAAISIIEQAPFFGITDIHVYYTKKAYYQNTKEKLDFLQKETPFSYQLLPYTSQDFRKEKTDFFVNTTADSLLQRKRDSLQYPDALILDLNYVPKCSTFLKEAKAQGKETMNGLGMLVFQGALAFEKWCHYPLPTKEIWPMLEEK